MRTYKGTTFFLDIFSLLPLYLKHSIISRCFTVRRKHLFMLARKKVFSRVPLDSRDFIYVKPSKMDLIAILSFLINFPFQHVKGTVPRDGIF